jgi:hypothetical protein
MFLRPRSVKLILLLENSELRISCSMADAIDFFTPLHGGSHIIDAMKTSGL